MITQKESFNQSYTGAPRCNQQSMFAPPLPNESNYTYSALNPGINYLEIKVGLTHLSNKIKHIRHCGLMYYLFGPDQDNRARKPD